MPGSLVLGTGGKSLNYRLPTNPSLGTVLNLLQARCWAFGSMHTGGANFVLADGSIRFISDGINNSPLVRIALFTREGGEPIDSTAF
jgi:prepilin-type processing-associated H-X9-DG protein